MYPLLFTTPDNWNCGSKAGTLTDSDINAIIAKGEKDTKELNEKMKEFTENAMKFTLDGNLSVYDYKDEEVEPPTHNVDLKAIIGGLQQRPNTRHDIMLFINQCFHSCLIVA